MTTPHLPAPIIDLLRAMHEALDVPLAATPADDQARARMLAQRVLDVEVMLESVLSAPVLVGPSHATQLRKWTAEHPVTYTPWVDNETSESDSEVSAHGADGGHGSAELRAVVER